ncbi:MAG: hypothetical protein ACT4PQ_08520 [Betaproteobacteria bacterium]
MLTRLIVDVYAWIIEIYLWLVLLISSVAGYLYSVPILKGAGLILEPQAGGKILGALLFASAAFLVSAVVMGPILVLFDIRRSIRSLEAKDGSFGARVQKTDRREPSL